MRDCELKTVEDLWQGARILSRISANMQRRIHSETVENPFAETRWPVYERYKLCGMEGFRHIEVPKLIAGPRGKRVRSIDPYSSEYADLFLTFARWFDSQGMEKIQPEDLSTLDTKRNAQAALAWAHDYGVLGLGRNPNSTYAVGGPLGSSSMQIAAERLGVPHLSHGGTRAYRMSAEGGKHETIEMFVLKAYEANMVLKLYEAAAAIRPDDKSAASINARYRSIIERYMSDRKPFDYCVPVNGRPRKYKRDAKTEKELWSQDDELAQVWALGAVENAVNANVEMDVYPVLLGESGSYEEGWGFKSLLGAMWLQMRWFMLGDKKEGFCLRCGELFEKTRRNKVYCGDACSGRARAAKAHERGKQRQQEAREETKRRLRR